MRANVEHNRDVKFIMLYLSLENIHAYHKKSLNMDKEMWRQCIPDTARSPWIPIEMWIENLVIDTPYVVRVGK